MLPMHHLFFYLVTKEGVTGSQDHASTRTSLKTLLATEVPSYGTLHARTTPAANCKVKKDRYNVYQGPRF